MKKYYNQINVLEEREKRRRDKDRKKAHSNREADPNETAA